MTRMEASDGSVGPVVCGIAAAALRSEMRRGLND